MGKLPREAVFIEDIADITICGKKEYARFGTSVAVIDLNGDVFWILQLGSLMQVQRL